MLPDWKENFKLIDLELPLLPPLLTTQNPAFAWSFARTFIALTNLEKKMIYCVEILFSVSNNVNFQFTQKECSMNIEQNWNWNVYY